jgi:GNAT superfamily N-acetyltransferase
MVQRRARYFLEVSDFELVSYGPEHRQDYLRLLRGAWGKGAMSGDEFDWWFDGNPAGSRRSVAGIDGRVVGVAGHSLYRVVLDGEEAVASASVHAVTDPSARGRGIFVELERKHEREAQERGVACVLAFASAPTAPLFLGPLAWTAIGKLRVWARPAWHRVSEGTLRSFDISGDLARDWPNHVIRDLEYLRWRYFESPRFYELVHDDHGYAFVWPAKRHKGRTISVIADHVGPTDLLREARQRAQARFQFALPAAEQRRAYLAAGFLPTPQTLNFMGKALAGRLNPDPRAWRVTLGDTDFF